MSEPTGHAAPSSPAQSWARSSGGPSVDDEVVLRAIDVTKAYGGVQALKSVTFEAFRGRVNVVVGENGAGKSTLMKILSGAEQPSSGSIVLDGQPVAIDSPRDASGLGIGIIHQELSLFPNMSIAENLFAGRELRRGRRFVDHAAQRARTAEVLGRLGQDLDPDGMVGDLPIGKQQLVEIARVLLEDVRILIMDEPTSALSNHEVDVLFGVMQDLRRDDVTIIYISHKLDEFRRIGDYVTVLRDGSVVAHEHMSGTDTGWIVRQMVGRDPDSLFARTPGVIGDVLLDCAWAGQTLAGFENHAGRTLLDDGAEPLGRVVSGFGNDGKSGFEGCRAGRVYGTYLHGPLLPRNPWFADRLLAEALGVDELAPLPDELEQQAHKVSARRARSRGGRF